MRASARGRPMPGNIPNAEFNVIRGLRAASGCAVPVRYRRRVAARAIPNSRHFPAEGPRRVWVWPRRRGWVRRATSTRRRGRPDTAVHTAATRHREGRRPPRARPWKTRCPPRTPLRSSCSPRSNPDPTRRLRPAPEQPTGPQALPRERRSRSLPCASPPPPADSSAPPASSYSTPFREDPVRCSRE